MPARTISWSSAMRIRLRPGIGFFRPTIPDWKAGRFLAAVSLYQSRPRSFPDAIPILAAAALIFKRFRASFWTMTIAYSSVSRKVSGQEQGPADLVRRVAHLGIHCHHERMLLID